ncbi:MAG: carboxylate--amine ligase [Clostridia bacterium]|nr:carboxylate--amine ligase [Clostridia bacterium]
MKIKNALRSWADRSQFGSIVFQFARGCVAKFMLIFPDKAYAKRFYKLYTKKKLDLDNPKTFDEKIWWLKLNNRDPLLTTCSDKNAVRKYVEDLGYKDILIEQVGLYKKAKDIEFDSFDSEVIIKSTTGSGQNVFYDPKNPKNRKMVKARMRYTLRQNPFILTREWNYKNIKPQITVEKVVRDSKGNLPLDYKFMCFDGEPKLLFMDIGLIDENMVYNHDYPRNIYDMDFNLMPIKETRDNYLGHVEKPKNWEKMKEIARVLSKPFPFCRVDLYNLEGKIYFGEITFYHGGGCNDVQPEEWDLRLGSWIDINNPKIVRKKK